MIKDKEIWQSWVEKNKDPYGKCCVDVAREVMHLLDDENHKDFGAYEIVCEADDSIKAGGITGFMAGCIAQMVSKCHSRRKEFKKKWNEYYALNEQDKDREGVINPALLTISIKEKA